MCECLLGFVCLQAVLDKSDSAVKDFLSRLPEETAGAHLEVVPLMKQVELLEKKDEGFVVPTQV